MDEDDFERHIHHPFCGTRGVRTFGKGAMSDGSEMFAINTRCLDGVDVQSLELRWHDGRSA